MVLIYSENFELFKKMIEKNKSVSLTQEIIKIKGNEITKLDFIRNFYINNEIQKVYAELIKIIFSVFEPNHISRRLGMRCCRRFNHSDKCYDKWKILKNYLQEYYLYDLTQCKNECKTIPNQIEP